MLEFRDSRVWPGHDIVGVSRALGQQCWLVVEEVVDASVDRVCDDGTGSASGRTEAGPPGGGLRDPPMTGPP